MSHLRKVGIRGYRSIASANLKLGEITVVIGPTDCGKSNVVRALRDWAFNPAGSGFVTKGLQQTRIAVAIGDALKVMFEKSVKGKKGAGAYVLVDADTGVKQRFEKIGRNVPVEIAAATGVDLLRVDDVQVKIQFDEQPKGWFLLSPDAWTPSKVSKVIGRVSGVDALLLAHRDLIQERNSLKKQIKSQGAVVEEAESNLAKLEWIEPCAEIVEKARTVSERIEAKRRRLHQAQQAILSLREQRRAQASHASRLEALEAVVAHLGTSGYEERSQRLQRAQGLAGRLKRLRERRQGALSANLSASEALQTAQADLRALSASQALLCPLCGQGAHPACRAALEAEAGA